MSETQNTINKFKEQEFTRKAERRRILKIIEGMHYRKTQNQGMYYRKAQNQNTGYRYWLDRDELIKLIEK